MHNLYLDPLHHVTNCHTYPPERDILYGQPHQTI